jgi:valyl-tRNA synthetase
MMDDENTTPLTTSASLSVPARPTLEGLEERSRARDAKRAAAFHALLIGATVEQGRERIVAALTAFGELVDEPRPTRHPVRFWENGRHPLEILIAPQWFVRTLDDVDIWLARGDELAWHPPAMRQRYVDWVQGLAADWNISRQRFFRVPFPV